MMVGRPAKDGVRFFISVARRTRLSHSLSRPLPTHRSFSQASEEGSHKMVNHAKFFNEEAKRRNHPYLVRLRTPTGKYRPAINLGGGLPCSSNFPFKEATFTLHSGEVVHLPQSLMEVALQYGPAGGIPDFVIQLRDFTAKMFNPPHMDERGLVVTAGSAHAIYLILHTFLETGDYIFVQESTYPTTIDAIKATNVKVVTVPNDSQGLRSDLLGEALSRTPAAHRKLLYVIPNGDNPTGVTMSESRRQEVYDVACEYDLLIMEDDPYHFMQYGPQAPPTFLSLDTEGRVLRIDTFAKTLGPGFRLGYITADKPFTDKVEAFTAIMTAHASILSQVVLSELLRHWGFEGFLKFTSKGCQAYKKKRDVILQAASKHLTGLCEWTAGDGMFLWLKVLGVEDTRRLTEQECNKKDLILVPGSACMWNETQPSPYIRVSFSIVTPEKADMGFQILADVIKEELQKKKQTNALNSDHKEAINGLTHDTKR